MPFNVALVAPEIPQNTGNIIRLCANTGARLHLVKPLGFELTEKSLRRASLDYSHLTNLTVHDSVGELIESNPDSRVFATTRGGATPYDQVEYHEGDTIMFGSESRGLSDEIVGATPPERLINIPMMPSNRSINLSNAVAIVLFEMWRQLGFTGAEAVRAKSGEYFS